MKCSYCGGETGVIDSRLSGDTVRRRRGCLSCGERFTTREFGLGFDANVKLVDLTVTELNEKVRYLTNLIAEKLRQRGDCDE